MSAAPYDQLHIYEVDGDARAVCAGLGEPFLGLWLEGPTSFLFFGQPAAAQVRGLVARDPALRLRDEHCLSYEQWQGGAGMEPLRVGGLTIAPAWAEPPDGPHLRLDPGLVFGNGLHPTTRHCLELLHLCRQEAPLGRVLDLGCGTGILGLAALAWGAAEALFVDLNPLCVATTSRNLALNGLAAEVHEGPAQEHLDRPARVVLANVHWEVQARLWADDAPLAGKEHLILSGVLRSQRGPLEDLLAARGFAVRARREAEFTWFSLWASRAGRP